MYYPGIHEWLETTPLTVKQQQKIMFAKNNWITRIAGVKRADKKRLN